MVPGHRLTENRGDMIYIQGVCLFNVQRTPENRTHYSLCLRVICISTNSDDVKCASYKLSDSHSCYVPIW